MTPFKQWHQQLVQESKADMKCRSLFSVMFRKPNLTSMFARMNSAASLLNNVKISGLWSEWPHVRVNGSLIDCPQPMELEGGVK